MPLLRNCLSISKRSIIIFFAGVARNMRLAFKSPVFAASAKDQRRAGSSLYQKGAKVDQASVDRLCHEL